MNRDAIRKIHEIERKKFIHSAMTTMAGWAFLEKTAELDPDEIGEELSFFIKNVIDFSEQIEEEFSLGKNR